MNSNHGIWKLGIFLFIAAFLGAGCATTARSLVKTDQRDQSVSSQIKNSDLLCKESPDTNTEDSSKRRQPPTDPEKMSDQELLDSALDLCETSNNLWERGDIENALESLDQAFSLVLKVTSDNPDILQQKDDLRFTISKRIVAIYSSRFITANGIKKAIPLDMNDHVKKAIASFTGKERCFFINAYRRSGRYRPFIVKELKKAGLPEELSWLPLIESGFKVKAFSSARALGLWQFIASTGYKFGLKRDMWVDERMDPQKSTLAAIAYLKELHRIFGDWTTALAAYNCGEGAVLRCIRKQKINYLDNFWDLYTNLPRETASYVPRFLAVLHILKDPKAYGIELPAPDKPLNFDLVQIDKQVSLKAVARHIGANYALLKELNPQLRRGCTPNRSFLLKVPAGKKDILLAKISRIPVWHPPVPPFIKHRVRRGETLSLLAHRYHTSVRSIMAMNRLGRRSYIKTGWILKIPLGKHYRATRQRSKALSSYATKKGNLVRYVVKRGDSLWKIADKFGTTTRTIKRINNLKSNYIKTGQTLLVPKSRKSGEA